MSCSSLPGFSISGLFLIYLNLCLLTSLHACYSEMIYVCFLCAVSNYIVFLFLFSSIKAGILRPAVGAGKGKMKLHDLLMCGFCSVANGEIAVVRTENLVLHIFVQSISWKKTVVGDFCLGLLGFWFFLRNPECLLILFICLFCHRVPGEFISFASAKSNYFWTFNRCMLVS